jgi:alkyldihydroxyacetonephosphate synthase
MAERRLKHFGWGREGEGLTPDEERATLDRYRRLFGVDRFEERKPPELSKIVLRPPRIAPPPLLAPRCSSEAYDRIAHTYGKSFSDYARGLAGQYDTAPMSSPTRATRPRSRRLSIGRPGQRPH